jgi:hypothetical protein
MWSYALVTAGLLVAATSGTAWLDVTSPVNWNVAGASLPAAPRPADADLAPGGRCQSELRPPSTPEDRAVVLRGWSLVGPYHRYGHTSVFLATSSADGMCRPSGFQGFVFVDGSFAGTLSPELMNSRSDAAIAGAGIDLYNDHALGVTFTRYAASDALCCPHASTSVSFEIKLADGRSIVTPVSAQTSKNGQ